MGKDANPNAIVEFRALIEAPTVSNQLKRALPQHFPVERFVRQALSLFQRTPKLQECSQFSILAGLFTAAELGLELAGPLGQAYLVPRWNGKQRCQEATFQIGYKGLIDLAYRSQMVKSFELRTVFAHDEFGFRLGTDKGITHIPTLDDPGEPVAYYAVIHTTTGGFDFEVMSKDAVIKHRNQYSPPPAGKPDYSAWATAFDAMAMKTVGRKLGRRAPIAIELQRASLMDEYGEAGAPIAIPSSMQGNTELPPPPPEVDEPAQLETKESAMEGLRKKLDEKQKT